MAYSNQTADAISSADKILKERHDLRGHSTGGRGLSLPAIALSNAIHRGYISEFDHDADMQAELADLAGIKINLRRDGDPEFAEI